MRPNWPKRIPPSVPLRGNCLLPTGKDASQQLQHFCLLYVTYTKAVLWGKLKEAQCFELMKSRATSIIISRPALLFLVTQGQKLGARGQWALLQHGLVKIIAAVGRITRGSRQNFCGFYLISLITSKCWVEAKYSTGSSKIAGCWLIFTGLQLYRAWVF